MSAPSARPRSTLSPSAASGERGPPAPSTIVIAASGRGGASLGREVGDRERRQRRARRRPSAAPSGSGTSGARGQTVSARLAARAGRGAPRRCEPSSSGAYDCAGLRAATATPSCAERVERRATPPGLADLGAGAGDEDGRVTRGRARRARRAASRTWSTRVRGRERDAQARGAGGHGRRADRGDEQAELEQRGRERRARATLVAARRPGRSATGGRAAAASTLRAQPGAEVVALLAAHDLERGERGGGVGRGRGGGEDVRAGPVDDELGERARARRRTRRARRGSSTACRPAAPARPGSTSRSGPSTAWASSSTSSASWRAAQLGERVDVGDVAVHREDGVGDHEHPPAVGPLARGARRARRGPGAGTPRPRRGRGGCRR